MSSLPPAAAPSKFLARMAVVGIAAAVVSLGTLAVWAAIVTQNGADGLNDAGVQTSGHLRAVQSLSLVDTQTDMLEERIIPSELAKLRRAQRVLDEALARMENGGVREASRIADEAKPMMRELKPAIEKFLARTPGYDSDGSTGPEKAMEDIMSKLQRLLNDLDPDPSRFLAAKLATVTASERTVRTTAFLLIPFGLGAVAACGWLLSLYRRRSEAIMRSAIDMTAEEARTDQLTGLPNRRALLEELETRVDGERPFTLALADLNGFKRYNDTFGHPAGDALLRRLGGKLSAACEGHAMPARLGGDEFCVLLSGHTPAGETYSLVTEALSDEGEGFRITAEAGMVSVPDEAQDPAAALHLADTRMYAAKARTRPSAEEGISTVLTRMLNERHPGLGTHVKDVAELAVACAETLAIPEDDIESVQRAAELHDLGKIAIPSEVLTKRGPLNDEEWDFMRRHSLIGERILGGLPSLEQVATMVRSSHERWDGGGYPDGLAGEEIPVGARIIFVADTFCAMTEDRPYAQAQSVETARKELRACSGTQFDPAVVTAFLEALDSRDSAPDDQGSPAMALA